MKHTNLLYIAHLERQAQKLQLAHGNKNLCAVFGAGAIKKPDIMFIFMNPTARNISSNPKWKGLRAPWLGTKDIWQLVYKTGYVSRELFEETQKRTPQEWSPAFCTNLYAACARRKIYITNLAKCTQSDARALPNKTFRQYLTLMHKEILYVRPRIIISFGNQTSSILLNKPISVAAYKNTAHELMRIENTLFKIFPVYYPVGQGKRNMPKAVARIKTIAKKYLG